MLLEVQGVDVIVREVLYDMSCYGPSTHRKTFPKLAKIEVEAENAALIQGSFHLEAFPKLTEYIEQSILEEQTNVFYISELCEKYSYFMKKPGLEEMKCQSIVLKAFLIEHFGEKLCCRVLCKWLYW